MTQALCLFCGGMKHGALVPCPTCDEPSPDFELSLAFTDHHLTPQELESLGDAVRTIKQLGLDEETSIAAFLYYVGRKWPKVLEFDADALPRDTAHELDGIYRSHLVSLAGQSTPTSIRPRWDEGSWATPHPDFEEAETAWARQVREVVAYGLDVAKRVVLLKIEAGQGATLQRLKFAVRHLFSRPRYDTMATAAAALVQDAAEYRRLVDRFQDAVKNGWSGRTRKQSEYLGGTYIRMEEMADLWNDT